MIKYFTIFNSRGQPRLKRVYEQKNHFNHEYYKKIVKKCLLREDNLTSVFIYQNAQVTYRKYANLVVVVAMDLDENEMAVYELIHKFMSILNTCFKQLNELELMMNAEKAYAVLDSMVVDGVVYNTNSAHILSHCI